MKYVNLEELIKNSFSNYISKGTILGIIHSILRPIAYDSAKALIISRFKNKDDIESLIKRIEYLQNVNMYDLTDRSLLKSDDFKSIEFLLVTSARFNIFIAWDYSLRGNNLSKIFFLTNSRLINDCFEIIQERMKIDVKEEFYSYRPERRENILLNEVLTNIIDILNKNVLENEFINKEEIQTAKKLEKLDEIKDIAHDIKNQIGVLNLNCAILEKKQGKSQELKAIQKTAEIMRLQLEEIKNIDLEEKTAEIKDIIKNAVDMTKESLIKNNNKVEICKDIDEFCFKYPEKKLRSAIVNILENANDAVQGDVFTIDLARDGKLLNILITNHGSAISEENKHEIFNSGFTTKEEGWGIGLYMTKKNIESLGGEIKLVDSTEEKTEFLIKVPAKDELTENEMYI